MDDALAIGTLELGYPVLGVPANLAVYAPICDQIVVAIGNNALHASFVGRLIKLGLSLAKVVHPKVMVSPRARLGAGSVVKAGAIVAAEVQLGLGVIVNCGAVVDHHAQVHDFAHLGANACMSGGSILCALAWMQAGAAIGCSEQQSDEATLKPCDSFEYENNFDY